MALEDISVTLNGTALFTERGSDDMTARIALSFGELIQLASMLPAEHKEQLAAALGWRPYQGELLPDGVLVAVMVSTEDIHDVLTEHHSKDASFEEAKRWLEENAGDVSDALVAQQSETLESMHELMSYAKKLPDLNPETPEDTPSLEDRGMHLGSYSS